MATVADVIHGFKKISKMRSKFPKWQGMAETQMKSVVGRLEKFSAVNIADKAIMMSAAKLDEIGVKISARALRKKLMLEV